MLVKKIVDFVYLKQEVRCQIKTISQIIFEQSIDKINLLKIDVEKAELDVLNGIEAQDWSKIQQIIIEVHNINNRVHYIVDLLTQKGFFLIVQQQNSVSKDLNVYNVYARR